MNPALETLSCMRHILDTIRPSSRFSLRSAIFEMICRAVIGTCRVSWSAISCVAILLAVEEYSPRILGLVADQRIISGPSPTVCWTTPTRAAVI